MFRLEESLCQRQPVRMLNDSRRQPRLKMHADDVHALVPQHEGISQFQPERR